MAIPETVIQMTAEEYLAREEYATVRHEFVDGQVFAMTGATKRHRTIAGNIYAALRAQIRGSRCSADISDAKVHVQATNCYYYPDVVVSCGTDADNSVVVSAPVLIVEVLSRSTAGIDRREKVIAYKKIESLREYIIVHQRIARIEVHRKNEAGTWSVEEFRKGQCLILSMPTGAFQLSLATIYEGVDWDDKGGWSVSESAANYDLDDESLMW